MNLQQFLEEISNIKIFLAQFSFKKVIFHDIDFNFTDDDFYYPIRLLMVPNIPVSQATAISFVLSRLYNTKFEIRSLCEDDDDIAPFLDPQNGIDILSNERDKIREAVLRIFAISASELSSLEFTTPTPISFLHAPKKWQELLRQAQNLIPQRANPVELPEQSSAEAAPSKTPKT